MKKANYYLIKYKYEMGVISLEDMCEYVEDEIITKDEFKDITRLEYDIIKNREWEITPYVLI